MARINPFFAILTESEIPQINEDGQLSKTNNNSIIFELLKMFGLMSSFVWNQVIQKIQDQQGSELKTLCNTPKSM